MPPPLPDRYRLEVRLGRDHDVEEWLGSDSSLDRPVLVRILGPETSPERRRDFLDAVRAAAGVSHPHLVAVFNAGEVEGGAFSVSEWAGGLTLADRLRAGEPIDPIEFLPNAAGLASALAALHREGVVHGAIDPGAIYYSVAHPAKLGRFGRPRESPTASNDVRSLASALEEAVTGEAPGVAPPSEVVDGLSPLVDRALARARSGAVTAAGFAEELASIPSPHPVHSEPASSSRRVLAVAVSLVLLALGLLGLGRLFLVEPGTPVIPPPLGSGVPEVPTTSTPPPRTALLETSVTSFDPFGDGNEHDADLPRLLDGDSATFWSTETYRDPLPLLKPGVGLLIQVEATPLRVELAGITPGTDYVIAWTDTEPSDLDWEVLARGRTAAGTLTLQLPPRSGGRFIVWFTALPGNPESGYSARVGEVRFRG
ncbi:MAG: hypothetical protein KatS3mg011_2145 [Acidimicrobiia bacterium]|nr:MAG: hypothetical protein KatS3mg011_2145 [Acidimicrobiia bacterium]